MKILAPSQWWHCFFTFYNLLLLFWLSKKKKKHLSGMCDFLSVMNINTITMIAKRTTKWDIIPIYFLQSPYMQWLIISPKASV